MGAACACASELTGRLNEEVARYKGQPSGLIQVLHRAQELNGFLSREVLTKVADELGVSLSQVYGVVSFYSLFTTMPKGRHTINVCMGTACYVRGASDLLSKIDEEVGLKPGETTDDRRFSLEVVRCVGACGLGPVVIVDEDTHPRLTGDKVGDVLKGYE